MAQPQNTARIEELREAFADRYVLGEMIGSGGFAEVFRATRIATGDEVALKLLFPQTGTDTAEFEHTFRREALLTSALMHPNTVRPLDYGIEDGTPYIVMQLLLGSPLDDVIKEQGVVSIDETLRILSQVLGSLAEAHKVGIVHSDIKPANIFLDGADRAARVVDFGIAVLTTDVATGGQIFGTPHYLPPEAALGKSAVPQSDIYSLGITAYEMTVGEVPYADKDHKKILASHVYEVLPELPREVANSTVGRFIKRATQKSPDARPNAVDALQLLLKGSTAMPAWTPRFRDTDVEAGAAPRLGSSHKLRLHHLGERTPAGRTPEPEFPFVVHQRSLNEALAMAVSMSAAGGGVIHISGPRGAGKRRLAREVLGSERLVMAEADVIAFSCQNNATRGTVDLGMIVEQLATRTTLPGNLKAVGLKLVERAWRATGQRRTGYDAGLVDNFVQYVLAVATQRRIAIVVADIEHADDATVSFIAGLAHHAQTDRNAPLLITTVNSDVPLARPSAGELNRTLREADMLRARNVRIGELTVAEVRRLLGAIGITTPVLVDTLTKHAAGNPGRLYRDVDMAFAESVLTRSRDRVVLELSKRPLDLISADPNAPAYARRYRSLLDEEKLLQLFATLLALGNPIRDGVLTAYVNQLAVTQPNFQQDLARALKRQLITIAHQDGRPASLVLPIHATLSTKVLLARSADGGVLPNRKREEVMRTAAEVLKQYGTTVDELGRGARLFGDMDQPAEAASLYVAAAVEAIVGNHIPRAHGMLRRASVWLEKVDDAAIHQRFQLATARLHVRGGRPAQALAALNAVIEDAATAGDEAGELKAQQIRAEIELERANSVAFDETYARIQQLLRTTEAVDTAIRTQILYAKNQWRLGKRREAASALIKAEAVSRKAGLHELRAEARLGICRALINEGKLERAEQMLREALRFLRASNAPDLQIATLVELGNLLETDKRPEEAARAIDRAQAIAEEFDRGMRLADILFAQAVSMTGREEYESATIPLLRALELHQSQDNPSGQGQCYRLLGECALHKGQVFAARGYLDSAYRVYEDIADPVGRARTLLVDARLELVRDDTAAALARGEEAAEELASAGNHRELAAALHTCGLAARQAGNPRLARDYMSRAMKVAHALGDVRLVGEIDEAMNDLHIRVRGPAMLSQSLIALHSGEAPAIGVGDLHFGQVLDESLPDDDFDFGDETTLVGGTSQWSAQDSGAFGRASTSVGIPTLDRALAARPKLDLREFSLVGVPKLGDDDLDN